MIRKVVNYYIFLMGDLPFIPDGISAPLEIRDVCPNNSGLFLNYAMRTPGPFLSVGYPRNTAHSYIPSVGF